ncbi:aminopeptidase N [Streptomyces sp. NPDC006684]|uniref:aminopeptidase N n=1 Tax=Streptomyces sp. NPDC006684 TaxID=3154477 RepID=UPI0034514FA9
MSVLTRDEAHTRSALLDVQRYEVRLDLTQGPETFGSATAIHFTARTEGDTFVELKPDTLHSIALDGTPLDPARLDGNRYPLPGLAAGAHTLTAEATMRYSRTGEGMHRFTDPSDGETYLYTQLFMEDVQRVLTAFDQPDLKAVFDLAVTAPEGWTVLANTVTTHDGHGTWTAATTPLISTYLLAVAAGPWHSVRTEHRGLPFGIHCRRSLAPHLDADAEEILDVTRALFDRYHEKFTEPYPFDSYDQAFVPEFNAGAMENPGLVTFRDEFVYRSAVTETERQTRAMVIAHEMAHMWFGDLVTLRWWDDIWLNESFAEYMGYQTLAEASTRFADTWTEFAVSRKTWGYEADQRPSTHPVAPDDVPDTAAALLNFDGISYAKGASALRQLVAWLGEKDFLAGINTHFARHKFANASLADFLDSLASATERDVHAWAESWLRTTGVDTLTPEPDETGTRLTVRHEGTRPHRVRLGLWDLDPEGTPRRRPDTWLDLTPGTPTTVTVDAPRPALVLLNDHDHTYAKTGFDDVSHATLTAHLSGITDPLSRAVVWTALRNAVRDNRLAPADYLAVVRAHLPHEDDAAVVRGVLQFAHTQVADQYTTAERRPEALALLGDTCRDLLRRTEDGHNPSLRLTAVRNLLHLATRPETLQDWYDNGTVPGGPALDPELRWTLLTRLAVLGATDETAIAAALDRDPSATGHEGAARCRAALPVPEAKEAAFRSLFEDDSLSNYLFTATAQGFWQPEQAALLAPYVDRYYPAALALAARRGPALAQAAGKTAFPTSAVTPAHLALGEETLRTATGATPALRRALADQLDDMRRALRVREGAKD